MSLIAFLQPRGPRPVGLGDLRGIRSSSRDPDARSILGVLLDGGLIDHAAHDGLVFRLLAEGLRSVDATSLAEGLAGLPAYAGAHVPTLAAAIQPYCEPTHAGEARTELERATFDLGSQTEVARYVLAQFAAPVVYTEQRLWRCGPDHVWVPVSDDEVSRAVQACDGLLCARAGDKGKSAPLKVSSPFVAGTTKLLHQSQARETFFLRREGAAFAGYFVTSDGVAPLTPEHGARHQYEFSIAGDDNPAAFLRWLCERHAGTSDLADRVQLLREFMGLAILGAGSRFHLCLMNEGEGGDGKSAWLEVLRACLPPTLVTSLPPHEMADREARTTLVGKVANLVDEVEPDAIEQGAGFKSIMSGEPVQVRTLYVGSGVIRIDAVHVFNLNRLMSVRDLSEGWFRRIRVMHWPHKMPEASRTPGFHLTLLREREQIIRWAVWGAVAAIRRGWLTNPQVSQDRIRDWRESGDQVAQFVSDANFVSSPVGDLAQRTWPTCAAVYDMYAGKGMWAEGAGVRHKLNRRSFLRRMQELGFRVAIRDGSRRISAVKGAPLKDSG